MKIKILSRWSSAAVFSVEASSLYLAALLEETR